MKKKLLYGVIAILFLCVVASLVTQKPDEEAAPVAATATSAPAAALPTDTPKPKAPTPVPPTNTPVPPTATLVPQLESITLTGSGDTIVNVDKPDLPAIARISTTQSGGNFAVISYDSSGNRIALLVNEIGSYSGIRPIDFLADEHTSRFEVKADGSWRIEILPLSSARSLSVPGKVSGTGADVILLHGSTPDVAQMSHSGDSNFVVIAHCASGRDLLVNEIGSYSGSVIVRGDAMILEIMADGDWSVDISSR